MAFIMLESRREWPNIEAFFQIGWKGLMSPNEGDQPKVEVRVFLPTEEVKNARPLRPDLCFGSRSPFNLTPYSGDLERYKGRYYRVYTMEFTASPEVDIQYSWQHPLKWVRNELDILESMYNTRYKALRQMYSVESDAISSLGLTVVEDDK